MQSPPAGVYMPLPTGERAYSDAAYSLVRRCFSYQARWLCRLGRPCACPAIRAATALPDERNASRPRLSRETVLAVPQVRVAARWISCSRAASIEM